MGRVPAGLLIGSASILLGPSATANSRGPQADEQADDSIADPSSLEGFRASLGNYGDVEFFNLTNSYLDSPPAENLGDYLRILEALHDHSMEVLEPLRADRPNTWLARGELAYRLGLAGTHRREIALRRDWSNEAWFEDAVVAIRSSGAASSEFEVDAAIAHAGVLFLERQPRRAFSILLEALSTPTIDETGKSFIQVELARFLIHQGNYTEALTRLDGVFQRTQGRLAKLESRFPRGTRHLSQLDRSEANDVDLVARAFGEAARAWAASGNFEKAIDAVLREVELATWLEDPWSLFGAVTHRFAVRSGQGQWARAASELEEFNDSALAEQLFLGERDALGSMIAIARIGSCRSGSTELQQAISSLELLVESQSLPAGYALGARVELVRALHDEGHRKRALFQCEKVLEQIQLNRSAEEIEDVIPILEQAMAVSTLSRVLIDIQAPKSRLFILEDRYLEVYRAFLELWAGTPTEASGSGFLQHESRRRVLSDYIRLVQELYSSHGAAELALDAVLRAQHVGTLTRRIAERWFGGAAPLPIQDALEFLRGAPPGQGFLIYTFGPDQSHVILVDGAGSVVEEIERHPTIEGFAHRSFLELTPGPESADSGVDTEPAYHALDALGTALVPNRLRPRVRNWQETTVVGLEELSFSPIDFLPMDPQRLEVGWGHPSTKLSSVELGVLLTRGPPPHALESQEEHPELVLRVAAIPRASDEIQLKYGTLDELEISLEKLRECTRPYSEEKTQTLIDTRASFDRVFGGTEGDSTALFLIAHGIRSPGSAFPAGIVLAGANTEGAIFFNKLDGLAHPELVVVSTCRADSAPSIPGDGGANRLSGAFFAGGTSCVVASQHDLELNSTVQLNQFALERLAVGVSPARAFYEARNELRKQRHGAHPSLFAPMDVLGLGHRKIPSLQTTTQATRSTNSKGRNSNRTLAGILFLVATVVVVFARRSSTAQPPANP